MPAFVPRSSISLLSYLFQQHNRWRPYSGYQLLEDDVDADHTNRRVLDTLIVSNHNHPFSRSFIMSESADTEKRRPQKSHPRQRRKIIYWSVAGGLGTAFVLALGSSRSLCAPPYVCLPEAVVTLALHFGRRSSPPPATTEKDPGTVVDTWVGGPVIATNFADPCFIEVDSTYYAFATNLYVTPQSGQINIQVAVSKDFSTWNLTGTDALPDVGQWSTGTYTWAPDVVQLVSYSESGAQELYTYSFKDDGSFVMYYSSRVKNNTGHHCVGAATSKNVLGPYIPLPEPIACPLRCVN